MSNHFTEAPAKLTAAQTMAHLSVRLSAHLLEGLEFLSAVLQFTGKGCGVTHAGWAQVEAGI